MVRVGRALRDWPAAPILTTGRLELQPMQVDHAGVAPLCDDPPLHAFIGGTPATVAELGTD